ncbi:helix-turn-helix domain-containing protein [Butyrivibrio sp. MC2013]|uniref:helix-turn-helix domain-containing protein n=1 Tax=Butyrivibrio sp. MC2013 TaxID=1280686 RepID=UPI0004087851|nr:helix-turn-helix transcriptional regulator [Butyrivibrio sp. MC2013]
MGIRNAGSIIKEARLRAGLTQEQLSEGICSLASMCNIETGKLGVSASTFQALMKKAGSSSEKMPIFKDRSDFDAYMYLKNARLYADKYCFKSAYDELIKLKLCSYGENRLYYQEALFLLARIKYLNGETNYSYLLDILNTAIHISHNELDFSDFSDIFLSYVDNEILILIANIYISSNKIPEAQSLCNEICKNLNRHVVNDKYTAYLQMLTCFTSSRLYFELGKYAEAKEQVTLAMHFSEEYYIETFRLEILFLSILIDCCIDKSSINNDLLYLLSLASYLGCSYVTRLKKRLKELNVPKEYLQVEDPSPVLLPDYDFTYPMDSLSDGVIDYNDDKALTLGRLIYSLRKEQHLSLNELSNGLCSASKLSKIENSTQAPGIHLAEALLNRLGYSERDFIFYGNTTESDYWQKKNRLLSMNHKEELYTEEYANIINSGMNSNNPAIKQLCILFENSKHLYSEDECAALNEGLKISIPDYSINTIGSKNLSWIEISLLNGICLKYIKSNKFDEAKKINDALLSYSQKHFVTPGYQVITMFSSYKLRFRYLYNIGEYRQIINELDLLDNEFLLKSSGSASDFYFYSSQALGEINNYDLMIKHARIAAGYFKLIGLESRKNYLISEIKEQFHVKV